MSRYLEPTPEIIAELRAQDAGVPSLDDDIRCLSLPDGDAMATRVYRRPANARHEPSRLQIVAPWLLADMFR